MSKLSKKIKDYFTFPIIIKTQNYLKSKAQYIIHKIKYYHTELKEYKESDLNNEEDRVLLDVFRDWMLGTLQYGLLMAIVLVSVTDIDINFIILIVSCGLARWLFLDLLKNIKQAIKW